MAWARQTSCEAQGIAALVVETKLRTIAQLQDFLKATPEVSFSGVDKEDDGERYAHISHELKRFDYPHRKKHERGVLLAYLQHTSG